MTIALALLGANVARSLSPFLHESAARALGHSVRYVAESVPAADGFATAVRRWQALGARGLNVTAPYKRPAHDLCSELGVEAREIGAVNTITFEPDGRLRGDNTDGPGLLSLLVRMSPATAGRISILGGGGAARAALWAAVRHGADRVEVLVRDPARMSVGESSGAPVRRLGAGSTEPGVFISALPAEDSATEQALASLPPNVHETVLLDLAYGGFGYETALVRRARAAGYSAYDGRSLLVAQAARSYRIWLGGELSSIERAMRDALKAADPVSPLL